MKGRDLDTYYIVMTNHFWLVWYRAQTPMGPKHWSLFVTYEIEEQALGTIYEACVKISVWLIRSWTDQFAVTPP